MSGEPALVLGGFFARLHNCRGGGVGGLGACQKNDCAQGRPLPANNTADELRPPLRCLDLPLHQLARRFGVAPVTRGCLLCHVLLQPAMYVLAVHCSGADLGARLPFPAREGRQN